MANLYTTWGINKHMADYSDEALLEAYLYETYGVQPKGEKSIFGSTYCNGFMDGKKWMDVDFASWRESSTRFGWDFMIRTLMDLNDPETIPGWVVKLALDKHIRKNSFTEHDNHLKLIDKLQKENDEKTK